MKVSALTTVLLLLLGSAVQPIVCFGHGSYDGHQRIYFQTWVVGEVSWTTKMNLSEHSSLQPSLRYVSPRCNDAYLRRMHSIL